jgi:phage shock protein C
VTDPKRLFRRSATGRIAGVCAGIAEYLDADVTLVRLLWIVLSIVPGGLFGGIVAYIVAWMIMPDATSPLLERDDVRRLTRSMAERRIAGVCGGLAEYFHVDPTAVRVLWAILAIVPGGIVFGLLAYLIAWFIMPVAPLPRVAHAASTA